MKTYDDCIFWMMELKAWKASAPEGARAVSNTQGHQNRWVLKDVDPAAIKAIAEKYDGTVAGELDGEYCYVDISTPTIIATNNPDRPTVPVPCKLQQHYRFFYRKTSQHEA